MQSTKNVSLARRLRARQRVLAVAVSMLALTATATAFGQTGRAQQVLTRVPKLGNLYSPAPPAAPDLAQIVLFRGAGQQLSSHGAAHVYVNGELEGAVMPDGYTRFCLTRGTYSVEAYAGDEPRYAGKENPKTEIDLEGGRTYFIGVSENGSGEPVPYRRADAERLLKTSREQVWVINRASAVVPCGNEHEPVKKVEQPTQTLLKFQLDASVLFDFARSDSSAVTPAGRAELENIAAQIRALPSDSVTRVVVRGHADPIGSDAFNVKLSTARAQTVSQVLSQAGIPAQLISAEGLGSSSLAVRCSPTGDMAKRIRCNAPNRRVEINVEGVKPEVRASN